jgi:hypothetical protein
MILNQGENKFGEEEEILNRNPVDESLCSTHITHLLTAASLALSILFLLGTLLCAAFDTYSL